MKKKKLKILQENFNKNLKRVVKLLNLYNKSSKRTQGRRATTDSDMLRASVVLLHATLEEVVRGLAVIYWVDKDPKFISDRVPLYDPSTDKRSKHPTKYELGDLCKLDKKMTIQEILEKSVESYIYSTFTINDEKQLNFELRNILDTNFIDNLKLLDPNQCTEISNPKRGANKKLYLGKELMDFFKRRHRIVHYADANSLKGRGNYGASSINNKKVRSWIECVQYVMAEVFKHAFSRL